MSGEVNVTPGYQIPGAGSTPVTVAMLNKLVTDLIVNVMQGAISMQELDQNIQNLLNAIPPSGGSGGIVPGVGTIVTDMIQDGQVTAPKLEASQQWLPGDYCDSAAAAKTGWLRCDGSAVSRTVYANLFAVIGTQFGVGDGVTTFNLPDFRGRVMYYAGSNPADTGAGVQITKTLGSVYGNDLHSHVLSGSSDPLNISMGNLPATMNFTIPSTPTKYNAGTQAGPPLISGGTGTGVAITLTNPAGGGIASRVTFNTFEPATPTGFAATAVDTSTPPVPNGIPRGQCGGYKYIKT